MDTNDHTIAGDIFQDLQGRGAENLGNHETQMDSVVEAFRIAVALLPDEETLAALELTVTTADSLAFMLAPPLEFTAANARLEDQKKLIGWARATYVLLLNLAARHGNSPS